MSSADILRHACTLALILTSADAHALRAKARAATDSTGRTKCAQIKAAFEPLLQRLKPDAPPAAAGDWKLNRALDLITELPPHAPPTAGFADTFFAGEFTQEHFIAYGAALSAGACAPGQESAMWAAVFEGAKLPHAAPRLRARVGTLIKARLQAPARISPTLDAIRGILETLRLAYDSKMIKAPASLPAAIAAQLAEIANLSVSAQRDFDVAFPKSKPAGIDAPEAQTWQEATEGADFARAKRALEGEYRGAVRLRDAIAALASDVDAIPEKPDAKKAKTTKRRAKF